MPKVSPATAKLVLEVKCRNARCEAPVGRACTYVTPHTFHQVRVNDAVRLMEKQAKAREWETLYGDHST